MSFAQFTRILSKNLKVYDVNATLGLCGWVLASGMSITSGE